MDSASSKSNTFRGESDLATGGSIRPAAISRNLRLLTETQVMARALFPGMAKDSVGHREDATVGVLAPSNLLTSGPLARGGPRLVNHNQKRWDRKGLTARKESLSKAAFITAGRRGSPTVISAHCQILRGRESHAATSHVANFVYQITRRRCEYPSSKIGAW